MCDSNPYDFGAQFDAQGVTTVVIGVGDGLETKYVDCLYANAGAILPVRTFDDSDFDMILNDLSEFLCPITPTASPTVEPTASPTTEPSVEPTIEPTLEPPVRPTRSPLEAGETAGPTGMPSSSP